jgi:RNA recognition motif-containing protein
MKNIFVGNLDFASREDDLQKLFEAFGAVDSITIVRDRDTGNPRGFAFVEMSDAAQAHAAIEALNGVRFHDRQLQLNEARSKLADSNRTEPPGKRQHRKHRFRAIRYWLRMPQA